MASSYSIIGDRTSGLAPSLKQLFYSSAFTYTLILVMTAVPTIPHKALEIVAIVTSILYWLYIFGVYRRIDLATNYQPEGSVLGNITETMKYFVFVAVVGVPIILFDILYARIAQLEKTTDSDIQQRLQKEIRSWRLACIIVSAVYLALSLLLIVSTDVIVENFFTSDT